MFYAVNEKRLEFLEKQINLISIASRLDDNVISDEGNKILQTIIDYNKALSLLDDYDHQCLKRPTGTLGCYKITYEECRKIIDAMKFDSKIFGVEKDGSFNSSINAIYQSAFGEDVYKSTEEKNEEKGANLLYFIVKNHSFVDGNKRIAASIFLYFLERNNILYVNDLKTSNLSEDFIQIFLDDKSFNKKIAPGKEEYVTFQVKTVDISGAGRNVNDEVNLNFILSEKKFGNPDTSNRYIVYVMLCVIISTIIMLIFIKLDKKKKLSLFVISAVFLCTTVVYANESITTQITGKIKYSSQNLLKESGIELDTYKVDYANSIDVWKYAQQVKNIIISDENIKPSDYKEKIDLTIGSKKRIYGYLVENGNDSVPYDLYISANGIIYAPEDSTGLFSFPNVEIIKGLEFVEFENTQNMSAMFSGNKKLKSANVKSINMQNAKNTSYMFNGCDNLDVKKSDFDVEHVENTLYMFEQKISDVVKENAKSDKGTNYSSAPITGNYIVESSKNDVNPIYYFRGAITNNNVKFANFCWKIVRTTETGGTKLVYNGIPDANGSCNNTGAASALDGTSKFAPGYKSPAYVGYMFGTIYDYNSKDLSSQTGEILYGNNFSWDGSKYTLVDTISSSSWKNDRVSLAVKYYYTCCVLYIYSYFYYSSTY